MGSRIELNGVLKLTDMAGMPQTPKLGVKYAFKLAGERLFLFSPILIELAREINGNWIIIGQARVIQQTLDTESHETSGIFIIDRLFPDKISKEITYYMSPEGKSYYDEP